jgi:hypothetical protein
MINQTNIISFLDFVSDKIIQYLKIKVRKSFCMQVLKNVKIYRAKYFSYQHCLFLLFRKENRSTNH